MICSGILLVIVLVAWPICYYTTKAELLSFEQVRITLNESRETMSEYERAAMVTEMSKKNAWLKEQQYWKGTIFSIFIPEDVNKTAFLRFKQQKDK